MMSNLDFSMNFEEMLEIMANLPNLRETYNLGFKECTARIDGQQDMARLEDFLYKITAYKFKNNITDGKAIQDMEILLEGAAKVWWLNLEVKPTTWIETICLIRKNLGYKLTSFAFTPIIAWPGVISDVNSL